MIVGKESDLKKNGRNQPSWNATTNISSAGKHTMIMDRLWADFAQSGVQWGFGGQIGSNFGPTMSYFCNKNNFAAFDAAQRRRHERCCVVQYVFQPPPRQI